MLQKELVQTPIQKMEINFNNNTFFIKRDDLIPFSFGGNKVRKAVLFFDDLKKEKCDCVITYGSSSSNHCRVVANLAKANDLPCFIISPNESNKDTFNSDMMRLFGAKIINCSVSDVKQTINKTLDDLRSVGNNPYFIPGGGHGNLGTKAYVNAYEEIREYELDNHVYFDYIFHTSGTGTTQAGLICGQIIHNDKRKIIGISNARKNPYGSNVVLDSVNDYLESIGQTPVDLDFINFNDDYILEGYSSYNTEILQTIKSILFQEGIPLDTTYTGKSFWGMKNYVKNNQITGRNILFIHTGGLPLFFDDLEEKLND